jgi:hypothetical protein
MPTDHDRCHATDRIQAAITDRMSDEQINTLLTSLDKAKAGVARRFHQEEIMASVRRLPEVNQATVVRS